MKKLTLVIFLAVAACFAVAQGPGGPGGPGKMRPGGMRGGGQRMSPEQRMAKMKKDYNLSDAQMKKISALEATRRAEFQKMQKTPGDMRSKGPQIKKMMDSYSANMKKIMNKDQFTKWDKDMQKRMSRMGGMRGGMRGPGGRPGGPGGPPKTGG